MAREDALDTLIIDILRKMSDLANLLKIIEDRESDVDRITDALHLLKKVPMTLALLTSSKAGVLVNALRKRGDIQDLRVAVLAKSIMDAWKGIAKGDVTAGSAGGGLFVAGAGAGAGAGVGAAAGGAGPPGAEPPGLPSRHPFDQLHWRLTSAPLPPAGDVQAALGYGYEAAGPRCSADRVRELRKGGAGGGPGPVLLWMQRDQRVADNWALVRASDVALSRGVPLAIVFNLTPSYLGANVRAYGFMLRGLREVETGAAALGLSFLVTCGDPVRQLPALAAALHAGLVVTDFSPLRPGRTWRTAVAASLPAGCGMEEVDAHNVVPAWRASDHVEVGARTIRKKIHAGVHKYGCPFPRVPVHAATLPEGVLQALPVYSGAGAGADEGALRLAPRTAEGRIAWGSLLPHLLIDFTVREVGWAVPGERGARDVLNQFLTSRLKKYDDDRNNPTVTAQSDLSPYLHFGQVAPQRVLLELRRMSGLTYAGLFPEGERKTSAAAFAEELVVRRELADNFCLYQPAYDSLQGASAWAQATLQDHAGDKREATYTRAQFEAGATHEALWNAAQAELVARGKMHGFMRMYWAKKVLEWSASPAEALATAIYLNDKYSLDGRDPNGYVGCAWAIAGVHDMGWAERPVFGKIRYMNLAGCKRKFAVDRYVAAWPTKARPALPAPTAPGGMAAVAAAAAAGEQ
jgi:deoxyribodipyrimidine photo-lyase